MVKLRDATAYFATEEFVGLKSKMQICIQNNGCDELALELIIKKQLSQKLVKKQLSQ